MTDYIVINGVRYELEEVNHLDQQEGSVYAEVWYKVDEEEDE